MIAMRFLLRTMSALVALMIYLTLFAASAQATDSSSEAMSSKEQTCQEGVVSFAHRGMVTRTLPENTTRGFKAARTAGACGNETDLRFSRDNGCWIQHDATLDRMTNGTGLIAHRPSSYIRGLRTTGSGDRVATCRQVISDAAHSSSRYLLLESKDGNRAQLAELMGYALRVHKSAEFITFTSGNLSKLRLVNSINKKELKNQLGDHDGFKTGWIWFDDHKRPALSVVPSYVSSLMLGQQALSVPYVEAAHKRGLLVSARGVDTRTQYRSTVGTMGADVIVTDRVSAVGK